MSCKAGEMVEGNACHVIESWAHMQDSEFHHET